MNFFDGGLMMADTLEAFVSRLQEDGVKAGEEAADKIRAEAEEQARQIVEDARAEADRIREKAEADGRETLARTETELKLAARDAVTRLQDTLGRALQSLLREAVQAQLSDAELIKELMQTIVAQYSKADCTGRAQVTFNVPQEMRDKLTHWVIQEFHSGLEKSSGLVDLHGTLRETGFEYNIKDGTVEITVASVVEILSELVGPQVRQHVSAAAAEA